MSNPFSMFCGKYEIKIDDFKEYKELWRFGVRRKNILDRDGNKCVICGSTYDLVVHHKDGKGRRLKHKNNDPSNLLTLCSSCHAKKHELGRKKLKMV